MIVTRSNFEEVLAGLMVAPKLALDTETTGLRMYHGDRLFSIIIADSAERAFYFNFQPYGDLDPEFTLTGYHLEKRMPKLFERKDIKIWYLQNAKFDMRMLAQEDLFLSGPIHCTKAIGRVEYNAHYDYSLDGQLARIGLKKDDAVKNYVEVNKLWDWVEIPGKSKRDKALHYDRVPFKIIAPYGETDGTGTFALGEWQVNSITQQVLDEDSKLAALPGGAPRERNLLKVLANERKITQTVFKMEHTGALIDRDFCRRAIEYEGDKKLGFERAFKADTGSDYKSSRPLFERCFANEKTKWQFTEKGNASFDSDILRTFDSPMAKTVLAIREAKSKLDFYQGFLYHADRNGRVHPSFNPDGAAHGRFSSSEPNFQNLTDEEDAVAEEFIVRRAIIPTPGFKLLSIDWQGMEYRFMLENACRLIGEETELVRLVKGGLDVHEATAIVASKSGIQITRKAAKTSNFLTLYGGGNQKLADGLACTLEQAKAIRSAIFEGAPEISRYIKWVSRKAETQGYITNWLGRRSWFPNRAFSYKAPNYHCSGGCADVAKIAMNQIDDLLEGRRSRMTMMIHDEFVFEMHPTEDLLVHDIQEIMESVYPSKYLELLTDASWSEKSLGDLA